MPSTPSIALGRDHAVPVNRFAAGGSAVVDEGRPHPLPVDDPQHGSWDRPVVCQARRLHARCGRERQRRRRQREFDQVGRTRPCESGGSAATTMAPAAVAKKRERRTTDPR